MMLGVLSLYACQAWAQGSGGQPANQERPASGAHRDGPASGCAPIQVREDGTVIKDGRPFYGAGVNYFSLFCGHLDHPQDPSFREGLATLKRYGIPFVRFNAGGFYPSDYRLYQQDPQRYWQLMDDVVRAAEEHGVGLVPSLFWASLTVPDLVGEPLSEWGSPDSKTIAWMRQYTTEFVTRYRNSPAIWMWEFGNEYNLGADLPNAADFRPPVWPELGTATTRSAKDGMTHDQIAVALVEFAKAVRAIDPRRPITSGNAITRGQAWHNWHEHNWTTDSRRQWAAMLIAENPAPLDTISLHVYPLEKTGSYFDDPAIGPAQLIGIAAGMAREAGRALFIGEWGVPSKGDPAGERQQFEAMLDAIVAHHVPLSAVWVYNFPGQEKDWNITADNDRSWMLELISQANRRLMQGTQTQPDGGPPAGPLPSGPRRQ
jgi:hypothetical protein